jgi:hypothetical protein
MACWIMVCPNCKSEITHSRVDIATKSWHSDPFAWLGIKPKFPDVGLRLECPACSKSSVFVQHQLLYSSTLGSD